MSDHIPGSPEPRTDAQQLLVIANRLDGMLEWLGDGHPGYYMIRDMPGIVRAIALRALESQSPAQTGWREVTDEMVERACEAFFVPFYKQNLGLKAVMKTTLTAALNPKGNT